MDIYEPLNDPNLPPTGEIWMLTDPSTGKIPQSLEENGRIPAPQREESSSNWKNHPATDHPSDPNPPPTGKIWTLTGPTAGRLFQWMEEYGLSRAP